MIGGRPNPFTNGVLGRLWWAGFRRRHLDFEIRIVQGVDNDRAIMVHPSVVLAFYDNLEKLYNLNTYGLSRIWNFDETNVQAGRNCGMRVIVKLGARSVPHLVSKSRVWVTMLACVSACGYIIPESYLFKSKRNIQNYTKNYEINALMAIQEHAWMKKELFMKWLKKIVANILGGVLPTKMGLLIFDDHDNHMAFKTIVEAKSTGIDLLMLSAHTSHKIQPLDANIFSPFKAYFK
jgi:hypothetical protein